MLTQEEGGQYRNGVRSVKNPVVIRIGRVEAGSVRPSEEQGIQHGNPVADIGAAVSIEIASAEEQPRILPPWLGDDRHAEVLIMLVVVTLVNPHPYQGEIMTSVGRAIPPALICQNALAR